MRAYRIVSEDDDDMKAKLRKAYEEGCEDGRRKGWEEAMEEAQRSGGFRDNGRYRYDGGNYRYDDDEGNYRRRGGNGRYY